MSTHKTPIQLIGLALFGIAIVLFTYMLNIDDFQLAPQMITDNLDQPWHQEALRAEAAEIGFYERKYATTFGFQEGLNELFAGAKTRIDNRIQNEGVPEGKEKWDVELADWVLPSKRFALTSAAQLGPVTNNPLLWLGLTIGLAVLGGLLYILPHLREQPGIQHNHIYHSSQTRGLQIGWRTFFLGLTAIGIVLYGLFYMEYKWFWPAVTVGIAAVIIALVFFVEGSAKRPNPRDAGPPHFSAYLGIFTGIYLIGFYVLLYWAPQHITAWVKMVDPVSRALSGNGASQWFLYGFMYTLIILVMGVRMLVKYRHNKYQLLRTGSVMFFQTSFAFLIPEILVALNKPWYDFKNIWPLDYDFFFGWQLDQFQSAGAVGLFMLVWGVALIIIGVPLMVHFLGKRWYCSWVCGCGGLAETLGDPFRQLSDKSLRAWKFERYIIHGVLVAAIVM
ncbi:MAG: 4Fe-4S binding protein, partial [Saprospiraceae bacterium]